jgi:hypothetical protein
VIYLEIGGKVLFGCLCRCFVPPFPYCQALCSSLNKGHGTGFEPPLLYDKFCGMHTLASMFMALFLFHWLQCQAAAQVA